MICTGLCPKEKMRRTMHFRQGQATRNYSFYAFFSFTYRDDGKYRIWLQFI
jgi:hypothetical protein